MAADVIDAMLRLCGCVSRSPALVAENVTLAAGAVSAPKDA